MDEQLRKKELQKTYFILLGVMIGGSALILGTQAGWNAIQQHISKATTENTGSPSPTTAKSSVDNEQTGNQSLDIFSNSTSLSSSEITVSQLSPEQMLREQYSLINSRQYQVAWNRLSPQFQNNKTIFSDGYLTYENWWKTVDYIKINSTKLINKTNNQASVYVDLSYRLQNGKLVNESRNIQLFWDDLAKTWMIDESVKIN